MIVARPLVMADAPAALGLLHAYDRRWFGEPVLTLSDLEGVWRIPGLDLALDSEGWEDDGTLVAFGTLTPRGALELAVDERWAGCGLEDALLRRWELRAVELGLPSLERELAAADTEGQELLRARGWVVARTGWILALPPGVVVPVPALPDGYEVRPPTTDDLPAAYTVIRDAFAEWLERPGPYEAWRTTSIDRPDLDLGHCRVVTCGDEVVGACVVLDPSVPAPGGRAPEVWVLQLAVRRDHRDRGLARALLASTALAARSRDVPGLALFTSARTGALGLYERLGMVVRQTMVECELRLDG